MSRILSRYLLRGLALNWLGMILLLTVIMAMAQLPGTLNRAVENEIAPQMIVKVLVLMLVANAPVLILLTLLLAVVLTFGRLGSESEITAMRAAGWSPLNLLGVVAIFSAPIVALLCVVALQFAPHALCAAVLLRADAARSFTATQIRPGKFQPFGRNGTLLAERVAKDGELQGLFVETESNGKTVVVLAARGHIRAVPEANEFVLSLYDGKYYEGVTGERRFRVVNFREYTRSIPLPEGTTVCTRPDARKTLDLFATGGPHDIAELNFRFGQLALALIFILLAVPLSTTRPREGAYTRVPAALGVFALGNFGLLGVASWSARAPALGSAVLWSCLALGLVIAIRWILTFGRVRMPA